MKKLLLVGTLATAMLLGSGIGRAAVSCTTNGCSGSDAAATTIEPILTRSSALTVDSSNSPAPNKIGNANIQSYSINASLGVITATITTRTPLITCNSATPGGACPTYSDVTNVLPYSGQHVMMLFQTGELEDDAEIIGKGATGNDVHWDQGVFNADGFRWWLGFGYTASEDRTACQLGYYDPTGALVPPAPVFFGQTFFSIGQPSVKNLQQPNTSCALSNGNKTVTIKLPYTYKWSDRTGLLVRSKQIVKAGDAISNVSAFSWLDHEIGGPDPVGLILGWTWYTDALPSTSYQYGLIAGDPNPNRLAGPKCITNDPLFGGDPVTGAPGPCTTANPVGAGFVFTHHNLTAAA